MVIDRGEIRDRKKKPPKKFRNDFGHTPLSIAEDIPWECLTRKLQVADTKPSRCFLNYLTWNLSLGDTP